MAELGERIHAPSSFRRTTGSCSRYPNNSIGLPYGPSKNRVPPAAGWRHRCLAWQQAMRGNHTGAAELALESGRSALEVGIPLFAAWALHEAFMFGHPVEAAGHLTEIANFSESLTFSYFAAQASALECADPTALTHVATSFAARGELLCHHRRPTLHFGANGRQSPCHDIHQARHSRPRRIHKLSRDTQTFAILEL